MLYHSKDVHVLQCHVACHMQGHRPGCLKSAGTGGNPELGEQAAQESHADLAEVVGGADMVRLNCWSNAGPSCCSV